LDTRSNKMISIGRGALNASKQKVQQPFSRLGQQAAVRAFGAMDQLNKELFEHKFTSNMHF